eukprot:gb/GFBE01018073.1/.p1 GENE.gb/GFBE01018073.1/~~gb/GFBE01018073.1/.p1  ORF type:complete len:216 (+),score=43.65 gb/GFBE01018073.1/:1-648(+)
MATVHKGQSKEMTSKMASALATATMTLPMIDFNLSPLSTPVELNFSKSVPVKVVPLMSPPKKRPTAVDRVSRCRSAVEDESSGDDQLPFFTLLRDGSEAECLEAVRSACVQALNKADCNRNTALHHAVRRCMPDVGQAILAREDFEALQVWDRNGDTALHVAVQQADEHMCRLILQKDATLALAENNAGETAAELALHMGNRSVIGAFQACRSRQ